jgi:GNAT superfamily N-acetyltransferase
VTPADGAILRFGRVTLRPPRPGDGGVIAPWFAETWRDVQGVTARSTLAPPAPEDWFADRRNDPATLLIEVHGEPVGFIRFGLAHGECVLRELGVRPERRNLGFGSEAVFALERQALSDGFTQGVAPVPLANGLAIYFWLRIGYRPCYPASAPPVGFTQMTRRLDGPLAAARESGSQTAAPRSGGRAPRRSAARRRSRSD